MEPLLILLYAGAGASAAVILIANDVRKYVLSKRNPYNNCIIYDYVTEKVDSNFQDITDRIQNMDVLDIIANLNSQRTGEYPLAKQNLPTIKFGEKGKGDFKTKGEYYPGSNKILYIPEHKELVFTHEILHAMSTHYDRDRIIIFSGFEQTSTRGCIGTQFNEAYTELLNNRYFGEKNPIDFSIPIVEILEEVVGKQEMEDMYFKADLHGLLGRFSEYASIEEIFDLLKGFDDCTSCYKKACRSQNSKAVQEFNQKVIGLQEKAFNIYFNKYDISDAYRVGSFTAKYINSLNAFFSVEQFPGEEKPQIQGDISSIFADTFQKYVQSKESKTSSSKAV